MKLRLPLVLLYALLYIVGTTNLYAQSIDSLEVTFSVNLAVQQELGTYDPATHTPAIAGVFTDWGTNAIELTDQVDTTFSTTFLFENVAVDSVIEYKFVLLNDDDTIYWEDGDNYSYTVTGTETDTDGNGILDAAVDRFFNDVDYSALDTPNEYDFTFSVNLEVMEEYGFFNPDSQVVKVVGDFNGWNTGTGVSLTEDSPSVYSGIVRLSSAGLPDTVFYKFILDDGEVTWDEPAELGLDGTNNRYYILNGTESDNNGDSIDDVDLGTDSFSDLEPELLNSVANAIATPDGDPISILGTVTRAYESFLFIQQDTAGIYTFNSSGPIYEAITTGAISPGDLIQIDALSGSFEGLQAFGDISFWRTIASGLPLPEPVTLTVDEFNNSGVNYNSELVKIEGLRIENAVQFTASSQYVVYEIATGDSLVMFVRGDNGSEVRGPIPNDFDYIGIAGYFAPNSPPNQLTPTYSEDIISNDPGLPVPTPPYEFGDIINYNGSFAALDLGPVSGDAQAWFFETFNGPSTYEIVDDSQDGDGKAAKATIEFDGTEDVWRAQMVNNPIYPAEGDLYNISFWMKSSEEGSVAEAFLGLPEEGSYQEVSTHFYELSTDWSYYEFQYFASDVDEDLSLRFGVKLNFGQNDGDMIYLDNVQMEKIEAIFTPVEFSVNIAVQEDLGNFDKNAQFVGVVGSFNGWDTNAPIMMEAEFGDSIYSGTVDLLNVAVDDEIRYKFITKDDSTGIFQWESPDPENPDTDGEFSDRIAFVDDVAGMVIPTVYFHDIDRADLNADNYGITSVMDARMSPFGSHLAIQGIVTRVTNNFVYVQDGTAGTNLFSRPFFSDINSLGFNDATKTGEIVKGDEVKIAGITGDFNGLHQLVNIHAWEVVSTGNPLPEAQLVDIEEYSTNGEEYESEIVRVERVRILDQVDSLKGGFIYEIVNEAETQVGWMSIQGSFNSDWAFQPAPQGFFNIEAVVKEFFIPSLDENIYAVSIHDESDIEIIPDDFDAEFSVNSFATLPGYVESINLDLIALGDEPIQGMEFTINFDPALVDVSLGDQTGTVLDGTSIISNKLDGQLLIAFATDGTPENDITDTGAFLNLVVDVLNVGETLISFTDILINELPSPELYSFVNIVPRLCGDVTGDETVSAEDATLVLQHTVKLEGVFPLVELDSTAADVTGNGDISAFDASWILQKTVGLRDNLGCITLPLKEDQQPVVANWMLTETDEAQSVIELDLSKNDFDIYSVQMELDISAGSAFKSIRNLPDSWNVITNTKADQTIIALYGVTPLEIDKLEIEMDVQNAQSVPKLNANLVLNERAAPELNELIIGDVPSEFGLNQNYPNPFNPSTNISYTLPEKADVELSIFNMLGQKVATVINQTQDAGTYTINWQAGSVSSGVYIYRLTAGGNTFTKRMMLIK